ncbi:MAG: alanine racemase [Firmicutes bacterium]|nr:alanine racemase [Bacillota bacterium]
MHRYRPTWAEINLANIAHNVREFRRHVGDGTRLMAVVKADGYGHGAVEVGRAALAAGADWLAVALVEEGIELRQAGIASPILVLGFLPPEGVNAALQYHLTPAVVDMNSLRLLEEEAMRQRRRVAVHLKVDTGMGRLGLRDEAAVALAERALKSPNLELQAIFTHFAAADDADKTFTMQQLDKFKRTVETLKGAPVLTHCSNSAATIDVPEARGDLVRIGISLYGLYPSSEVKPLVDLRPALSLHTQVATVKEVPAGTPISYGCTFVTERPSRIATLPIGYADGYNRRLSGRANVLLRGKRVPLVGRVCMDYCMADVTDLDGVEPGEQVTLYGSQGAATISVDETARLLDTINYEITCAVSARVPRIYRRQG